MTGHPFRMTLTIGEGPQMRTFTIDGVTPFLDNGNLLNDRLGFAHGSNCLIWCSKSLAEAGVWSAWQETAKRHDMRRLPRMKM